MQVSAFTSQAAWYSFLTVRRVGGVAARRSTAERLTWIDSKASGVSAMPVLRCELRSISSWARATAAVVCMAGVLRCRLDHQGCAL